MKKISFVSTVKNDPQGLQILLDSLKKQTVKPDEVIVIDGVKTKTNRSQGRNLAIKKAQGKIIAVADAGCQLKINWLEEITKPFADPQIDVVAGFYKPIAKNIFQKCLACYTCVMKPPSKNHFFLPSSRSLAFRQKAWQKVNGYPEELDFCEDLIFAQKMKRAGQRFQTAPKAIVYWPQRENLAQAFRQFFHYASGDVQAGYWPHLRKILFVYLRYIVAIWLLSQSRPYALMAFLAYLVWAVGKNYRYVDHPLALVYLPLLQITADLAVMLGALRGLLKKV